MGRKGQCHKDLIAALVLFCSKRRWKSNPTSGIRVPRTTASPSIRRHKATKNQNRTYPVVILPVDIARGVCIEEESQFVDSPLPC